MFKYFTFGDESISSLKKQYWKLARQYHPDFNGNTEQANNIMKEINKAKKYFRKNKIDYAASYTYLKIYLA